MSGNLYNLKNIINFNYLSYSFDILIHTSVDFKNVEIDDLTNDNCLFLDEQDKDVFDNVKDAVLTKTKEVVNNNLVKSGLEFLVSSDYEENIEKTNIRLQNTEDLSDEEKLKNEAKNKIINSVSKAMSKAQNDGKEFVLNDLLDVVIPDSDFLISLEDNIAIVKIDGYEFKIDSNFKLYESNN